MVGAKRGYFSKVSKSDMPGYFKQGINSLNCTPYSTWDSVTIRLNASSTVRIMASRLGTKKWANSETELNFAEYQKT